MIRQALAADTSGAAGIRALTNLRSMAADSGFDHEFVRQQIEHHRQELIAIKMFGEAAKDDDLKDELKRATALQRHLAPARVVAALRTASIVRRRFARFTCGSCR